MTKLKKAGVLMVATIIMVVSVLNVYAGTGNGGIFKGNTRVGIWYNYMEKQYAKAYTMDVTSVHYDKTTYMTVNVQSIYPYGGSHAYYINKTLSANNTIDGKDSDKAIAEKTIPTTEYGTSAYTKHIIIIEGTAYTPAYTNGTSNIVKPD